MKTHESIENRKFPLRRVAAGLAATAALLTVGNAIANEDKKPQETVRVEEHPAPEAPVAPEVVEDEQSRSTIDVFMTDQKHFQAEVIIDPEDSNIGVPVEGDGRVRLDANSDEQLYQSVALADIVSDDDFKVDVISFKIGDRELNTKQYEGIAKIKVEDNHYQIAIVHPEQFKPDGLITVSLDGETNKANVTVDGGVSFTLLKAEDAATFLP